jgi:hypothetical protein
VTTRCSSCRSHRADMGAARVTPLANLGLLEPRGDR